MNTEQVTVAGKTFSMPNPFDEGHTLTSGEAGQLNQVYHENIRNNFAKRVKEAVEKNTFDQSALQAAIDEYAGKYEFGKRAGGGPRAPVDPVAKEALRLATNVVENHIRKQGKKIADFTAASIKESAAKLVASNPIFNEKAAQNVAEKQALAEQAIGDIMSSLEVKPAEVAEAPAE